MASPYLHMDSVLGLHNHQPAHPKSWWGSASSRLCNPTADLQDFHFLCIQPCFLIIWCFWGQFRLVTDDELFVHWHRLPCDLLGSDNANKEGFLKLYFCCAPLCPAQEQKIHFPTLLWISHLLHWMSLGGSSPESCWSTANLWVVSSMSL